MIAFLFFNIVSFVFLTLLFLNFWDFAMIQFFFFFFLNKKYFRKQWWLVCVSTMYGSWGFLGDEQKMMTSPIYFHSFKSWRQTEAFVWETTPYLFFIFVFLIFYLFIFCLFILRLGIMMKNYLIIYCDENYILLILNTCLIKFWFNLQDM